MSAVPDEVAAGPVVLRRWHVDHLPALMHAIEVSFTELQQWMPWAQSMPTAEAEHQVLIAGEADFDGDRDWGFSIFERDTGELVGGAGLHRRRPEATEIGYWVRTDRTGRGYATAAAKALTEVALRCLVGIDRVEIRMDAANRASAAVPPKIGYELDRIEEREIVTAGHSGRGYVYTYSAERT